MEEPVHYDEQDDDGQRRERPVHQADQRRNVAGVNAVAADIGRDDFGTGQSNLERLRWYPFSELKIDRSFLTDDSSGSGSDWIIVRNAVTMAQQLGLEVVAEGVEDTRTLRRLRDLGCDRAQGYLISPPVPAAEFGERCEAWSQMAATLY